MIRFRSVVISQSHISVNDLPNSLVMLKAILFADDATVYASSSSLPDLARHINHELRILANWFKVWYFSLPSTSIDIVSSSIGCL